MADESAYDDPVKIDLVFHYFIVADMAEQDVFLEHEPGSGKVWRATKADQNLAQPIYAATEPMARALFDPEAIGPYERGRDFGTTLGEWFDAKGRGTSSWRRRRQSPL